MARRKVTNYGALKTCRKDLGLSQQELGELLGVSRNTIRAWELGKEPRFLTLLCKGLKAYRVLPHTFIEFSGSCLADARGRMGLRQDQLAESLGLSRATLSRYENDTPPRWLILAIAALAFTD